MNPHGATQTLEYTNSRKTEDASTETVLPQKEACFRRPGRVRSHATQQAERNRLHVCRNNNHWTCFLGSFPYSFFSRLICGVFSSALRSVARARAIIRANRLLLVVATCHVRHPTRLICPPALIGLRFTDMSNVGEREGPCSTVGLGFHMERGDAPASSYLHLPSSSKPFLTPSIRLSIIE